MPPATGWSAKRGAVPCPDVQNAKGLCLLFHGFANAKDSMLPAARAFHELGYDTLLVDFRGSGESDGQTTTIGYGESDDVAAACTYAERQWPDSPILLYGRSMRSVAVLRAVATQHVRPTALLLEAPFDRLPGMKTWALLAGAGHENLAAKHHAEWLAAVEGFLCEIAPKRRSEKLRPVGTALNTGETAE